MSLPGQGDVGAEPNWLFKYTIDNLKMIAAEQNMSAFVTYREGPLKNKVCWKKLPYQITKEHLKPNPACDGIWIRNLKPVGEVTTMNDGGDPDWEFVPEMSRAGQGDVGSEANWAQKYSIDQLKQVCIERGYSGFVNYKSGVQHPMAGKVAWKKFSFQLDASFLTKNPACEGTWLRKNYPPPDDEWEFVFEASKAG